MNFVGTFLSTIPFARKYGVLQSPLELWIEDSTIQKIATDVPGLEHDFNKYLDANPSNRRIEELGIGTNEGVKSLYARNAGFEERHCGLHLGLGGGAKGSHHLDLIFEKGCWRWIMSRCSMGGLCFRGNLRGGGEPAGLFASKPAPTLDRQ